MTARTKDETLRVADAALLPIIGPEEYRTRAIAAVLEAVGFFRLEEQRDELTKALNGTANFYRQGADCWCDEARGPSMHTDYCRAASTAIANAEAR